MSQGRCDGSRGLADFVLHTPKDSTSVENPFRWAFPVMSTTDAPVVSLVISSDVPVVSLTDVSITHPNVVAPIGGKEATFSTAVEDPIAAHISHIYEGLHTSSFVEGEVHSASESDGAESHSFNSEDFHPDNVFGKLDIQKGVTHADQIKESAWQQSPSKRGKVDQKTC